MHRFEIRARLRPMPRIHRLDAANNARISGLARACHVHVRNRLHAIDITGGKGCFQNAVNQIRIARLSE